MLDKDKSGVRNVSFLLLTVFGLLLVVEAVNPVIKTYLASQSGNENINKYLYICILQITFFLIPSLVYVIFNKTKKPRDMLKFRGFNIKYIPFIITISLTTSLGVFFVNFLMTILIPAKETVLNTFSAFEYSNGVELIVMLAAVVVVPAIAEEVLMRGVVMSEFNWLGTTFAIIVSAFTFSTLHSSFLNLLGPTLAGIVYGYLTYKFNSILPSIIAHMTNNMIAWFLNNYLIKSNVQINPLVMLMLAVVIFLVLLLISLKLLEGVVTDKHLQTQPVPRKSLYTQFSSLFNIFFLIFLFLWIIKSVLEYMGISMSYLVENLVFRI